MKLFKKLFLLLILVTIIPVVKAEEKINIYLFSSELCSTCQKEEEFLEEFAKENNVNVINL